jgi:arylsulfatase A-like enzyme
VLIISSPEAVANGKSSPALVEFVDIYPTLCELAGLDIPDYLEGTSMVPLLTEPDRPWKTAVFSISLMGFFRRFMGKSIRTKDYHYVEWRDLISGRFIARELYDHRDDPGENVNVASDYYNQKLVKQLGGLLAIGWTAVTPRKKNP